MSVNEIRDLKTIINKVVFLKKQLLFNETLGIKKDLMLLGRKSIKKYLILVILKNTYQSFIRKKNRKSVKQSEIVTYQPNMFENSNLVDIKSVIAKHPKT